MTRAWPFKGCPPSVSREDHARLWLRYQDLKDDRTRLESENHDLREMLRRAGDQIETDWHITPGVCDCEPWDRRHHPALDEIRAYFTRMGGDGHRIEEAP